MYAWTNLVIFVASVLSQILGVYFWIVIVAAVLTWVEPNPYNPIVRFLHSVTEPVFDWVREHVPVFFGGIDFSPLVVILAIQFLQQYLIPTVTRALISGFA
ncbi:MAG TPA: YggT family protein [Candidatus Binataceae bacterium]|nr:YggT family protein [Candidatus Binataceae bacterium]